MDTQRPIGTAGLRLNRLVHLTVLYVVAFCLFVLFFFEKNGILKLYRATRRWIDYYTMGSTMVAQKDIDNGEETL